MYTLAGFAVARFAPPPDVIVGLEERVAELRRPPRTGFTDAQEERLTLWKGWMLDYRQRPATSSS